MPFPQKDGLSRLDIAHRPLEYRDKKLPENKVTSKRLTFSKKLDAVSLRQPQKSPPKSYFTFSFKWYQHL